MSETLLLDTHIALWLDTGNDRLLIATAIALGCPLVTYDAHIAKFAKKHRRRHGFDVAA